MKRFIKIAAGIDVRTINAQLDANAQLWDQFGLRKKAADSPHGQMSDIWVRYNDIRPYQARNDFKGFNDAHDSVWYPAYYALPALRGIIFRLMRLVDGERLGGVLITRIPPGGGIALHTDAGWHVDHYDKFYLSLKSSPGAQFCCPDEDLHPRPGEIYRFDNRIPHWVKNESSEDRVTLIMCIRTDMFEGHPNVPAA